MREKIEKVFISFYLFCFILISSINHGKYFHNKITMPFLVSVSVCAWKKKELLEDEDMEEYMR